MAWNRDIIANTGQFVPTTHLWDVGQIQDIDVNSTDFKELLVRLYLTINNLSTSVNAKKTGSYLKEEISDGSLYFGTISSNQSDLRSVFHKTFDIGPLGAGITTVAHGLVFPTPVLLGATNGAGLLNGIVPSGNGFLGQYFSIAGVIFVVNSVVAGPQVLNRVPAGGTIHTFDASTGAYSFTGEALLTNVYYYPQVWSSVRIYGSATSLVTNDMYPLPFASAGGVTNIELKVGVTNISINNNSGVVFATCTVVLEYLKQ